MRPSNVARLLSAIIPTKRPVFLWGPPGVGKSDVVRQAAANYGEYLDIRLVYHDPSDLKFPVVNPNDPYNPVRWVNSLFPKDPKWVGVINLEELAQSPPLMQATAMQLTLDRQVGDYRLPEAAAVIACSNRAEDRAGAGRVITPVLNRFLHVDLDVSHEDWMTWSAGAEVRPEVRAFLNFRPALLHQFDPASGARAFASPRSWHMVSDVLPATPPDLLLDAAAGCVGHAAAVEFLAFVQIWQGLPDPDSVLKNPAQATVPSNPAVLYALCGALAERMRTGDSSLVSKLLAYSKRLPGEFSVLLVRESVLANVKVMMADPKATGMSDWLARNKGVLGVN